MTPSCPKPYKFIGFSDIYGPKSYKFIGFGDIYGPKPVAGFWMLLKIYIFNSGRDPRDPPNRPGKADPDPQISSNNHRQSLISEAGVGDRLATLRVSRAKR